MNLSPERKKLFAERLEQACISHYGKKHGIASRLAGDMDVSIQTASKWLRGSVMPEPHRWGVIAGKLGVSTQWLIGSSHEAPSAISDQFEDEGLELAAKVVQIVHPLVMRLKPGISKEEMDDLARHAYQQLKAGVSESTVSGEIASRLL